MLVTRLGDHVASADVTVLPHKPKQSAQAQRYRRDLWRLLSSNVGSNLGDRPRRETTTKPFKEPNLNL
jgi:hypothetical protein